jgi:hypothetical protein
VPLIDRIRHKYWLYRGDVHPWFFLLIRKGPRCVWRRLTQAPVTRPGHLGYSRVARGYLPGHDVVIALYPQGTVDPHPQFIDPLHVRDFLTEVLPGWPLAPHLAARVAMTEEHGPRSSVCFTGYGPRDDLSVNGGDLEFGFLGYGRLYIAATSVHRPPSDDHPLFDVVDVLRPLYLVLVDASSGACDGLFGRPGTRRLRYQWELRIAEHIVFPTPLAGDRAVGFTSRVPTGIPLGGHWREPSEIEYRGWNLSHSQRRPHQIVEFVLGELLALWGYEADPVVMAEVLARLRSMRVNQPISDRL